MRHRTEGAPPEAGSVLAAAAAEAQLSGGAAAQLAAARHICAEAIATPLQVGLHRRRAHPAVPPHGNISVTKPSDMSHRAQRFFAGQSFSGASLAVMEYAAVKGCQESC